MRRHRLGFMAGLCLVVLISGTVLPADADVPPPHRVVSNYETATGLQLHRDGGISVPLPPMPGQPVNENRSLWLFGDTLQTDAQGNPTPAALPFWVGTFAAIGPSTPGLVPTSLSHVPTPPAAMTVPNSAMPSPLFSLPAGLKLPGGAPCAGDDARYPAAWPTGATRGPSGPMTLSDQGAPVTVPDGSQLVFISVSDVCVFAASLGSDCADADIWADFGPVAWTFQRTRLVAYRPADNQIVANTTLFQTTDGSCLPWQKVLAQPVFSGGQLYMFGSDCTSYATAFGACLAGSVTAFRAPAASFHDSTTYLWAAGGSWTPVHTAATTVTPVTPSRLGPILLDVHDFSSAGEGFLMLEQTTFGGHYNIYEASTPAGPWALRESDVMPGCASGSDGGCYALYGHPELSTPGHLMYSFHNMDHGDRTEGYVKLTDVGSIP
jgi:hypothetical protein